MDVPVTLVHPDGREYTAHTQVEAARLAARGYRPKDDLGEQKRAVAERTRRMYVDTDDTEHPDAHWYDAGGLLPPGTLLAASQPEPVVPPHDEPSDDDPS